jgi:hypothetical protein
MVTLLILHPEDALILDICICSSFSLRPRVCPIGFTGQGFGVATLMHPAPIDILSAYDPDETTSPTFEVLMRLLHAHARCTLFPSTRVVFVPIGFLLLGKVLMRQLRSA